MEFDLSLEKKDLRGYCATLKKSLWGMNHTASLRQVLHIYKLNILYCGTLFVYKRICIFFKVGLSLKIDLYHRCDINLDFQYKKRYSSKFIPCFWPFTCSLWLEVNQWSQSGTRKSRIFSTCIITQILGPGGLVPD